VRQRGLRASEMAESLLALWAADGERAEALDQFRQDQALALLLGHDLPAAQTARDFLAQFHATDLPALQAGKASVPGESVPLLGLAKTNQELVLDLQCRCPVTTATIDVDATVIHCDKRAAKRAYDGHRGYQPVLALWAEQDVILAVELRDGNSLPRCGPGCRPARAIVEWSKRRWRRCPAVSPSSICAATARSTSTI
jgi:hypothetical protein